MANQSGHQRAGSCCGDACCPPAEQSEVQQPTPLPIVWQRLVSATGQTCPRCDATGQNLKSAVAKLTEMLKPLNIEPRFETHEIDETSFKNEPVQSNRIWIARRPLEDWLGANVGTSACCSVCGDEPCRTMEIEGSVFEEIPEAVILKAALIAASGMVTPPPGRNGLACADTQ